MSAPAAFKATYRDSERWRPVIDFEGLYEVSDQGRVRSIDRCVLTRRGIVQRWKGKLLSVACPEGRYPNVFLSRNGVEKSFMVHVLVARAFIGERPIGLDICHNDGDRENCRESNLRYDTRANNHADKFSHGTSCHGEKNHSAKLTKNDIRNIRVLARTTTQREIADVFGITQSNVSCIVSRKSWRHI